MATTERCNRGGPYASSGTATDMRHAAVFTGLHGEMTKSTGGMNHSPRWKRPWPMPNTSSAFTKLVVLRGSGREPRTPPQEVLFAKA